VEYPKYNVSKEINPPQNNWIKEWKINLIQYMVLCFNGKYSIANINTPNEK
jgi:hypothetical protein